MRVVAGSVEPPRSREIGRQVVRGNHGGVRGGARSARQHTNREDRGSSSPASSSSTTAWRGHKSKCQNAKCSLQRATRQV